MRRLLERQVNESSRSYRTILHTYQAEQVKTSELAKYCTEYSKYVDNLSNEQVSVTKYQVGLKFLQHVQTLQVKQIDSKARIKSELDVQKKAWIELQNRYTTLDNYIKKLEANIRYEADLAEQKQMDTLINDLYAHKLLRN